MVSACLLGVPCRYDGHQIFYEDLQARLIGEAILFFCPEQMGGLNTPRPPCEIVGGDGAGVLAGTARVQTEDGLDCSAAFIHGARRTAALARQYGVNTVILKQRSPSCGKGLIYDGSFTRRLRLGNGVTAALLLQQGLTVLNEKEYLQI
jgi:uncharacterized protein YbbK (DUF523 family)